MISGFEVVKAIESIGSRSGEPAVDMVIADCGVVSNGTGAMMAAKPAVDTAIADCIVCMTTHMRESQIGRLLSPQCGATLWLEHSSQCAPEL